MSFQRPYEEERPWGKFIRFTENENTTVKIIDVKPQQQLSVQRHQNRDELWVALDSGLVALVGENTIFMTTVAVKVDPVFIPRGTVHSIKNTNLVSNARFLEVAFGSFDENDIERLQDIYGRK